MASVATAVPQSRRASISLRSGGAIVLGMRLAGAGTLFALQVILARSLGDAGYGVYAFAMAWMQGLAVFGRAGLENASLRLVSEHSSQQNAAGLASFLAWSRRANLLTSVLAGSVLVGCAFLAAGESTVTRNAMLLGAVALPLLTTRQIQEAQLRAVHFVWQSMLGQALWPLLTGLFVLAAVYGGGWSVPPTGAIGMQIAALAICSLLTLWFVFESPLARDTEQKSPQGSVAARVWRKAALTFLAFDAVILLRGRTSVIIAGLLIDTDTAGVYAIAERFAEVVMLGVTSISTYAAPHFASLHAAGRHTELRGLIRRSRRLGLLFAIPCAAALAIFGRPLLRMVGEGYVTAYPLLVILLFSVAIGSIAGPAAYYLAMSGRERVTLHGAILCMVVNLTLSFALCTLYGALGLAITHLVTMTVWTVYLLWHARR